MRKINAKEEKSARNKLYAEKFKRDRKRKKTVSVGANWCRIKGHPASCSCAYPSREEVIEASRRR